MPVDLFQALAAIEGEDGQLKTAAQKLGHEPEMGQMDAAGVTSGLGQAMGRGPMDVKALLDEKALEAAGAELSGRTFGQDPRERSGARNLSNRPGPGPVSPTDPSRVATKPSNIALRTGPATHRSDTLVGKTAGRYGSAGGMPKSLLSWRERAVEGAKEVGEHVSRNRGKYIAGGAAGAGGGAAGYAAGRKHKKTAGRYGSAGGMPKSLLSWRERASEGVREGAEAVRGHLTKHKGRYIAGGAAGAGGGAAGYAAGRKHKVKAASLSLAQFIDLQGNEAGIKMASQAYGDGEVLARTIQLREAQSVGMKLACGMFSAAAAENAG